MLTIVDLLILLVKLTNFLWACNQSFLGAWLTLHASHHSTLTTVLLCPSTSHHSHESGVQIQSSTCWQVAMVTCLLELVGILSAVLFLFNVSWLSIPWCDTPTYLVHLMQNPLKGEKRMTNELLTLKSFRHEEIIIDNQ